LNFLNVGVYGVNKNGVLAEATLIMIVIGIALIAMGAFRYRDIAGCGFALQRWLCDRSGYLML
jgi:hypothetical protein